MLSKVLSITVLLVVAAAASAEDKITFGSKYEPGSYVTTIKSQGENSQVYGSQEKKMSSEVTLTCEIVAEKPAEHGQALAVVFRRVQTRLSPSGSPERSFDSALSSEENNGSEDYEHKQLRAMLDKKTDVSLDEKGSIEKMAVPEDWKNKGMETSVKVALGMDVFFLPDKAVGVGDHWEHAVKGKNPT